MAPIRGSAAGDFNADGKLDLAILVLQEGDAVSDSVVMLLGRGDGTLNDQGEVVGQSDLVGDANFHAFRWRKNSGIEDLGTLAGDVNSVALGVNDSGEIVGLSLDANFDAHPYVWRNGVMINLNSLIPADSPLTLFIACSINSSGEIVGLAVTSTGVVHGYLAAPVKMAGPTVNTAP